MKTASFETPATFEMFHFLQGAWGMRDEWVTNIKFSFPMIPSFNLEPLMNLILFQVPLLHLRLLQSMPPSPPHQSHHQFVAFCKFFLKLKFQKIKPDKFVKTKNSKNTKDSLWFKTMVRVATCFKGPGNKSED